MRREGGGKAPLLTSELSLTGAFTGAIGLYGSWFGRQSLSNKCDVEKKNPSTSVWAESQALRLFYSFGHRVGIGGCINISMCFQVKCACCNCLRITCHRMKESTLHGLFSLSLFPNIPSAVELAKVTNSNVKVDILHQNTLRAATKASHFNLYSVIKTLGLNGLTHDL